MFRKTPAAERDSGWDVPGHSHKVILLFLRAAGQGHRRDVRRIRSSSPGCSSEGSKDKERGMAEGF